MVVHGEAEEDGKEEERHPYLYDLGVLEAKEICAALLEDQDHESVGGADG